MVGIIVSAVLAAWFAFAGVWLLLYRKERPAIWRAQVPEGVTYYGFKPPTSSCVSVPLRVSGHDIYSFCFLPAQALPV